MDRPVMPAVRVLVADDEPLFLEALWTFLADDERIEVVGSAADGEEAVQLAEALQPDLILMDKSMPRMDGIEATRRIRELVPRACILILTSSESPDDMQMATEAGASGYLSKESASSEIVGAILDIASLATRRD
jgi:DNA-binding NarL/FixJ family response regulator